MSHERTFVMLKPGVLQRRLVGEVVGRFERKGLNVIAMKLMYIDRTLAERHYQEHVDKPFFASLVDYITSGPVIAMVWEGESAISTVRTLAGATNPQNAAPGTIRGDLALVTQNNVVHASDSPESSAREMSLFFEDTEILPFVDGNAEWLG
ncbi:MAG: nucleoside-diphosphate kinase [Spirochaetota bacterium]